MRVGLHVYNLPPGHFASVIMPSDYAYGQNPKGLGTSRLRARAARRVALAVLGEADPMPLCPTSREVLGQPCNTLEVIEEPR